MERTFQTLAASIKKSINQVIVGKSTAIDQLIIALVSGGHVLIEDVPGVGKTTLVSALAKSLDLSFKRIQFTPDLMPSDITGFNLYNPKLGEFVFQPGNIMAHIVLADEINRTSPKTQSALLEVMQEHKISVDGQTLSLPEPFMVLATQNPIEHVGTYALPEAQLDRFMLKIHLDYPTQSEELSILEIEDPTTILNQIQPVANRDDILWMRQQVSKVYASDPIKQYIVDLVNQTRHHKDLMIGASPRSAQALLKASKAHALLKGRDFVIPDDVMALVVPVLSHRLSLKAQRRYQAASTTEVLNDILKAVLVKTV